MPTKTLGLAVLLGSLSALSASAMDLGRDVTFHGTGVPATVLAAGQGADLAYSAFTDIGNGYHQNQGR